MPKLPDLREGFPAKSNQTNIQFSLWPTYKRKKRYSLQYRLFATSPWNSFRSSIIKKIDGKKRKLSIAFLEQSEEFYNAYLRAHTTSAKPLLIYYSFLNLAKSYLVTENVDFFTKKAAHGVYEQEGTTPLVSSKIKKQRNSPNRISVYEKFEKALGDNHLTQDEIPMRKILPQILQGHRMWCEASGKSERFIALQDIYIRHNSSQKELWMDIIVADGDLKRFGISHKQFLEESCLVSNFNEVKPELRPGYLRFQQKTVVKYSHRPVDKVLNLVETIRPYLWTNILSTPPYRNYYLYLSPKSEKKFRMHQLMSIYLLFFYLGSVTRYRPHRFEKILAGNYGVQVEEAVVNLPKQFLYLIASQFAEREVTKAAIV